MRCREVQDRAIWGRMPLEVGWVRGTGSNYGPVIQRGMLSMWKARQVRTKEDRSRVEVRCDAIMRINSVGRYGGGV